MGPETSLFTMAFGLQAPQLRHFAMDFTPSDRCRVQGDSTAPEFPETPPKAYFWALRR